MKVPLHNQIAIAIVALTSTGLAAAAPYTATLLGDYSVAHAINNAGQVAGRVGGGGLSFGNATVWNGNTTVTLNGLGGSQGDAIAINDRGQVVGYSFPPGSRVATRWDDSIATRLSPFASVVAISNSGIVVGNSGFGGVGTAAYLENASLTQLPGISPFNFVIANSINETGQIVGEGWGPNGPTSHALLWNGTISTRLGNLDGVPDEPEHPLVIVSSAKDINSFGQVVGVAQKSKSIQVATVWNGLIATRLDSLIGANTSYATANNDKGQIVGVSGNRAVIWNDTTVTDLNTYLDESLVSAGWVLTAASDINFSGTVVGNAHNSLTGRDSGFILAVSVVTEPQTHTLVLVGLGVIAGVIRRRSKSR